MKRSVILSLILASSVLFLDICTKNIMAEILFSQDITLLPNLLSFSLHYNTGLALSIPLPRLAQIILSCVLLVLLFVLWKKEYPHLGKQLALAAVFGGALGNLGERIFVGQVVDFIAVWQFPVFNIADIAISLGISAYILFEFQNRKKESLS